MKKLIPLFALIMICGFITSAKAQKSFKPLIKVSNLTSYNFIDDAAFTPGGGAQSNLLNISKEEIKINIDPAAPDAIESSSPVQAKYAMLMDVAVESITSLSLYKFIEDWYGTRYRMGGCTKKGIDCSAFTSTLLLAIYSLSVPRTAREQYKVSEHISKEDLREGDLVFFNTRGGVSHVGLYLANDYFVHSSASNGVMISSLDDSYYSNRFISGGRVMCE